jgi:phosphoenolpyruvate-protein kinase (PTS system EI component)
MAYVSGQAGGLVVGAPAPMRSEGILILHQRDLARRPPRPLPAGIILVDGAPFSHRAIALRCWGRPTLILDGRDFGEADQRALLGRRVLLDGSRGLVRVAAAGSLPAPPPAAPSGIPVRTRDGTAVRLRASVRDAAGARRARQLGAESIGLVRSELLLPDAGRLPDTDFFLRTLGELCAAAAPLPVRVRLLDLAPDKLPDWIGPDPAMITPLGLQGTRLFDREPVRSVLRAQLAAVRGLAACHPLSVILPYPTRVEELDRWVALLRRATGGRVAVGAMAESPGALLDIGHWLDRADFVGIGCNDLMQTLFAADRDQPPLRGHLDPYAPVLYRLLAQAAAAAGERCERIQLCGLLAQLQGVLAVLVGLGYRAFSVDAHELPYLARALRGISLPAARTLADAVCAATTSAQVRGLLGLPAAGRGRGCRA